MNKRRQFRCDPDAFTNESVPLDRIRCAVAAAVEVMDGEARECLMFHLVSAGRAEGISGGGRARGAHLLVITAKRDVVMGKPQFARWLAPFYSSLDDGRIGVCDVGESDGAMDGIVRGIAAIPDDEIFLGAQWIGHRIADGVREIFTAHDLAMVDTPNLRVAAGFHDEVHPLLADAVYFKAADPGAFNAGMERVDGALVVACRYYGKEPGLRNRIALSRVDERGHAMDRKPLEMDAAVAGRIENFRGIDDPRLFYHGGKLFCSISSSAFPPYRTRMFYGEIAERGERWEFVSLHEPKRWFRKWRKQEKNWQFFESDGGLYACYDHDRGRFFRIKRGRITKVIDGAPAKWGYGVIRGGTPPRVYGKDSLITFFHSYVGEKGKEERMYYMGALVFDRKPPFTPRMISREPMLSADDSILNRGPFPERKVVFPSGAVEAGEGYLVSLGVNDCDSAFIRVTMEDMKLKEML